MIKKILVSQPKPTSDKSPYFDIATKYGIELIFRPFIRVESITPYEFRQQKVNIVEHTAIVFTSRHAIDNFFKLAKEVRVNVSENMKYFCVTETVALYLQRYIQYRKRKVFFGNTGKIDALIPIMLRHKEERFLVPTSDVQDGSIKKMLDSSHLQHTECVMYRTVSNDFTPEEIASFDYDMLIFFSPAGVDSLTKNFPNFDQRDIVIATFGPATARAVISAGLRLDLKAPTEQHASMTGALENYLNGKIH